MKLFKYSLFLIIGIPLLISCNFSNKKADSSNHSSLTIGVMSSMDYLPLAVAKREGYFEKYGVDINIQKFISANERDASFQAGSVDGGITDFTSAAIMRNAGYDMKLTSKCQAPFYIIAGKNSNIYELKDLKGKKVAVSQNTVIDFCIDAALKSIGLTNQDVNKQEINKIPLRFEMLQSGQTDATGLPAPFGLIAKNEGHRLVANMDELGYTITGIVFSQEAIDTKKDAIANMYKAYNDGVDYLKTHSAEDIRDILEKDLNFPEHIVGQVDINIYTHAQGISATDKDITEVIAWLKDRQVIDSKMNHSDIINNEFIR